MYKENKEGERVSSCPTPPLHKTKIEEISFSFPNDLYPCTCYQGRIYMYVPDVINISKTFPINSIQNKLIPQAEPPCSIERLLKSD